MLRIAFRSTKRGRCRQSLTILRGLAVAFPNILVIRIWLARFELLFNNEIEAMEAIRSDVVDKLDTFERHCRRIGLLHLRLEDAGKAMSYLRLAVQLRPTSVAAWRALADAYLMENDGKNVDEAIKCFRHISSVAGTEHGRFHALCRAAEALSNAGRDDAEGVWQELCELDPQGGWQYFGLVDCNKSINASHPVAEKVRSILQEPEVDDFSRKNLHFAMGLAYDRSDNPAASFAHYQLANSYRRAEHPLVTSDGLKAEVAARCDVFTKERIDDLSSAGCQDDFLILIVGMPRSGTTLLHQILGMCDGTYSAGERTDFAELRNMLPEIINSKLRYPRCISKLTAAHVRKLSLTLKSRLDRISHGSRHMIIKTPDNCVEIGFIKILFPNSRIINCRRDVVDTCFSCFTQNFGSVSFASDLVLLRAYCDSYLQIMRHWRSIFVENSIVDVFYEQLVDDPEVVVRNLCILMNVKFDVRCLDYYKSNRVVPTMSRWQVRQPVYKTSVKRSDRYREFLGGFVDVESIRDA